MIYRKIIKPITDVLVALLLVVTLSPVLIIISLFLFFSFGSSPFFSQLRGGYKGETFKIVKFKTMTDECDENGKLLSDHLRLTKVGRFVRSTSLDELPQLFNVIKGDMSFIGPRPLIAEYLEIYTSEEAKRHDVKPGITGWAQVNGRNAITWKTKFKFDLWYVENLSLLTDINIAFLTAIKILRRDSVDQSADVTMEKYNGSN